MVVGPVDEVVSGEVPVADGRELGAEVAAVVVALVGVLADCLGAALPQAATRLTARAATASRTSHFTPTEGTGGLFSACSSRNRRLLCVSTPSTRAGFHAGARSRPRSRARRR